MAQIHQLAAMMFAGIVGYTALMGRDEERAFQVLRKNREIHIELIENFGGTLIKEIGDGMLIRFNLKFDPFLENIRYEERFINLIEKVKNKWETI